jgi:hypothetical protein
MPEITIYTNDGDCANGVAEINPFTVGDATDEWTLKFNNGTDFYAPSNVTMRVGHTNGLPDGTYNDAFKWVDRAGNQSIASIAVTSGVPLVTFDTDPLGGVIGDNGVYILRGPELDGRLLSATILDQGLYLDNYGNDIEYITVSSASSTPAIVKVNISGSVTVQTWMEGNTARYNRWAQGYVSSISIEEAGLDIDETGQTYGPFKSKKFLQVVSTTAGNSTIYTQIYEDGHSAVFRFLSATAKYQFPFKRDESGNDIIAATTLSPYSDGEVNSTTQYDHSTLVIRPETVATASLTQSGTDWVGTMNPINSYVTERLALRNSTQLDIQIRGDGRTLFQGQLTVLNKIA